MANWGYSKDDGTLLKYVNEEPNLVFSSSRTTGLGPDTWSHKYPNAAGKSQSPVNIQTSSVHCDTSLGPMTIKYVPNNCVNVANTGNGAQVNVNGTGSLLEGGGLKPYGQFQLLQFHFHWGANQKEGSEHTIDGRRYAAELHLVHWNRTKYSTPEEATAGENGLAVLGVFIKVGEKNPNFTKLQEHFKSVHYKGEKISIDSFDPSTLLPLKLINYYFYHGSLTTPPCHESVLWTVFQHPIEMSEEQLNTFRNMSHCEAGCGDVPILRNFRPPMPLGDRQIKASFIGHE